MELIKKSESALGLIWSKDVGSAAYMKKIEEVKEAVGTRYLTMVNGQCLWKEEGKKHFMKVMLLSLSSLKTQKV